MTPTSTSAMTTSHIARWRNGWMQKFLLVVLWGGVFAGLAAWLPRGPERRLTGTGTLRIEGITKEGTLVAFGLMSGDTSAEPVPQSLVLVDLPTGSVRRVYFRPGEGAQSNRGKKETLSNRLRQVVIAGDYIAATFQKKVGDIVLLLVWDSRTGEERLQRLYSSCEIRSRGDSFLVNGHSGARRASIAIIDPGTGSEEDQVGRATWELANPAFQELESPFHIQVGGPDGQSVSLTYSSQVTVSSDWRWLATVIPAHIIDGRPEALWAIIDMESGEVVAERRELTPGSVNRLVIHNKDHSVVGYSETRLGKSTPAAENVMVWHWERDLKRGTRESDTGPNASTKEKDVFARLDPQSEAFSMPTSHAQSFPWAKLPEAVLDGECVTEIATGLRIGTVPQSEELIEINSTGRWGLVTPSGSTINRIAESISPHADRLSKLLAVDEVSLFDITEGRAVATLWPGPRMFSPDGHWFVLNGTAEGGALEIWHLPPGRPWGRAALFSLLVPAAMLLSRNLQRRPSTESRSILMPEPELVFPTTGPGDASLATGIDFPPADSDSTARTGNDSPSEWT